MRYLILTALSLAAGVSPARAEFHAYYQGVDRMTDKEVPATAALHIQPGQAAIVVTGSRTMRMIFLEEPAILRFVDDAEMSYFDMDAGTSASGMTAEMEQRLAQLPPDQRKMAEDMIQNSLGANRPTATADFVSTKVTRKILEHDCTMIDVVRGGEKVGEYCGSKSKDFLLSETEKTTMRAMQKQLDNFFIALGSLEGGGARAFQWDAGADAFPLLSRCIEEKKITFDVELASFDRKPLETDPFAVSQDYEMKDVPEAPSGE